MRSRPSFRAAPLLVAVATLAACGGGPEYANDGDTGAAAPATQQTLSPNPSMGAPSEGLGGRAHTGMMAGDSGRPSLTTDSAGRVPGANPEPVKRP